MANKSNVLHLPFQGGTTPRKTFNLIEYIYNVHLSLAEDLITLLVQPLKNSKNNAQNFLVTFPHFF